MSEVAQKVSPKKISTDEWVKAVKKLELAGLKGEEKKVFDMVKVHQNIPKSATKFSNFCIHNLKVKDAKVVNRVWGHLSVALGEAKKGSPVAAPKETKQAKKAKIEQKLKSKKDTKSVSKDQKQAVSNEASGGISALDEEFRKIIHSIEFREKPSLLLEDYIELMKRFWHYAENRWGNPSKPEGPKQQQQQNGTAGNKGTNNKPDKKTVQQEVNKKKAQAKPSEVELKNQKNKKQEVEDDDEDDEEDDNSDVMSLDDEDLDDSDDGLDGSDDEDLDLDDEDSDDEDLSDDDDDDDDDE